MVGWSVSVLGDLSINNLLRAWIQWKWWKGGNRNPCYLGTSTNGHMISVNVMSSFILKYLLQNLKSSLVAKRTIGGGTLGCLVDSWVTFGDRISTALPHHFLTLCWGDNIFMHSIPYFQTCATVWKRPNAESCPKRRKKSFSAWRRSSLIIIWPGR